MDSFVDKLAQRFNAGEIIKANGEAEAMETNRLRAQADEYDRVIKEMRRLNLKTAEMSEQVSQMIQCGIEQIESYQDRVKEAEDIVNKETETVREIVESGAEKQKEDFLKIASNQQEMLIESIEREEHMLTKWSEDQQEAMRNLENRLMTLRAAIEESLTDMENSLKSGTKDYEPILKVIMSETVTKERFLENVNELKFILEENNKQLTEHVHKENVKVYRNVQAVLNDQARNQSNLVSDQISAVEKTNKKQGVFIALTFLATVGSLVIQILQLLNLI